MVVVLVLTDKSNSCLRLVLVRTGHVQVINKVDKSRLALRTERFTTTLLELAFKRSLKHLRIRIEVEVNGLLKIVSTLEFFRSDLVEETLCDLSLAATCCTNKHWRVLHCKESLHKIRHGDCVRGRHGKA